MLRKRVIPVLLLLEDELVKTVGFDQPRYVGDPINAVRIFNEKEVDEIMLLDISSHKKAGQWQPNYDLLHEISSESFVPLCYGGGVSDFDTFRSLIKLGYERIVLTSAGISNPDFVKECAARFGSSAVIGGIDYRTEGKERIVYTAGGKINSGQSIVDYASQLEALGAGEILLHAIDRDGSYQGYDLEALQLLEHAINIPVTICGGAGSVEDVKEALKQEVAGVAAGSIFVFYGKHRAVLINYPETEIC